MERRRRNVASLMTGGTDVPGGTPFSSAASTCAAVSAGRGGSALAIGTNRAKKKANDRRRIGGHLGGGAGGQEWQAIIRVNGRKCAVNEKVNAAAPTDRRVVVAGVRTGSCTYRSSCASGPTLHHRSVRRPCCGSRP